MDLSQTVLDLSKLQEAANDLAGVIHPTAMSAHQIVQACSRWAEMKEVFQELDDGPLGATEEAGDGTKLSAETVKKLKRLGLNPAFVGIQNEAQLREMKKDKVLKRHIGLGVDFRDCTNAEEAEARIAVARATAAGRKVAQS